jgi:hypothetical protein
MRFQITGDADGSIERVNSNGLLSMEMDKSINRDLDEGHDESMVLAGQGTVP